MPINWRNGSPFCDSRGAAVSGRVTMPPVQRLGWPERHCGQLPQKPERQATTWSPGLTVVTSAPTASTTPAPSCPSTIGRSSGKRPIPSTTCRSLWHTPVATVRTSTSRPHGLSTSTCSIVSGACTLRKTAALISIGLPPHRIDLAATACDEPDQDHRDERQPDPACWTRGRRGGAHHNRGGRGKLFIRRRLSRSARPLRRWRASLRHCAAGSARALPRRSALRRAPSWSSRSRTRCRRCRTRCARRRTA